MLVRDLLQSSAGQLSDAGVDSPATDAELLLGHCLQKSRTALYLAAEEHIPSVSAAQFNKLLSRRLAREPLAYILGVQEFWSLDFLVTPHVLIPRPETELLLEKAIECFRQKSDREGLVLDLCCGSGAIAIVLAKELDRPVLAIDISLDAIRVAQKNCVKHGVSHLVSFLQSDLLSAIIPKPLFSLVVSNPPYVSQESMKQGLQPEVDQYEPHLALDGGVKGLEIVKQIHKQLLATSCVGGFVFVEIGAEQGADIASMYETKSSGDQSFCDVLIQKDYAGHDRILSARMGTSTGS